MMRAGTRRRAMHPRRCFWQRYFWIDGSSLRQGIVTVEQLRSGREVVADVQVNAFHVIGPGVLRFSTSWPVDEDLGYQRVYDIARVLVGLC